MPLTTDEATAIARSIVVALCGSRWVYPAVRFVDEYPTTDSGMVILSGRPVQVIHSVTVGGKLVDPADYRVTNGFVLDLRTRLTPGGSLRVPSACRRPGTVEVDYTYGVLELPGIVQRAIDVLAKEIGLADSNDNACRIPERVTSVTRQGVSWTLLDPQDFLDDGRTGIYEVDLAIRAVNPSGAKRRPRVFSIRQSAPALRRTP